MEAALSTSSEDDSRPASMSGLGLLLAAREDATLLHPNTSSILSFTSRNQWSPASASPLPRHRRSSHGVAFLQRLSALLEHWQPVNILPGAPLCDLQANSSQD